LETVKTVAFKLHQRQPPFLFTAGPLLSFPDGPSIPLPSILRYSSPHL
jgi:hypothetical protein